MSCLGNHRHVRLKGGTKCTNAAVYTREFCEAIVEGFELHLTKTGKPCRRIGSLESRDVVDSKANTLALTEDDPEDCRGMDELLEIFENLPYD